MNGIMPKKKRVHHSSQSREENNQIDIDSNIHAPHQLPKRKKININVDSEEEI